MRYCGFQSKEISFLETRLHSALTKVPEINKVKVFGLSGLFGFLRELTAPKEAAQKKRHKPVGQRLDFAEAWEFFGVDVSTLYC